MNYRLIPFQRGTISDFTCVEINQQHALVVPKDYGHNFLRVAIVGVVLNYLWGREIRGVSMTLIISSSQVSPDLRFVPSNATVEERNAFPYRIKN